MTGPLILITLGILFLLDNLYPGQFEFGRMWPIILIVIGMVKIFEYFGISGDAPRHRATRHGPVRRRAGTSATSEDRVLVGPTARLTGGRAAPQTPLPFCSRAVRWYT